MINLYIVLMLSYRLLNRGGGWGGGGRGVGGDIAAGRWYANLGVRGSVADHDR